MDGWMDGWMDGEGGVRGYGGQGQPYCMTHCSWVNERLVLQRHDAVSTLSLSPRSYEGTPTKNNKISQ